MNPAPEVVILLHGAGRTPRSMRRPARALAQAGYRVYNLGYPSRLAPVEALAENVRGQIERIQPKPGATLHFVTHSLGGIVLRCYLEAARPPHLGRSVMLAPPNQGAALADVFGKFPLFDWILGPVAAQIGTGPGSLPKALGPAHSEVGIIAGNRSLDPLFSALLPGPDDGRVAVAETRLEGMADFIVLPCAHTFMMNHPQVIRQTLHFLATGKFAHPQVA